MYVKTLFLAVALALAVVCYGAQGGTDDERAVRELIGKWNEAYQSLDAKAIAALETPDFEVVSRFGSWHPQSSREENERMWAWTFAEAYRGRPGPKHAIDRIRFITPEVAIVQTRGYRTESVTLSDGTRIPPFGQTITFIVVKRKEGWRITAQNTHNQMKNIDLDGADPDKMPWNRAAHADPRQEK